MKIFFIRLAPGLVYCSFPNRVPGFILKKITLPIPEKKHILIFLGIKAFVLVISRSFLISMADGKFIGLIMIHFHFKQNCGLSCTPINQISLRVSNINKKNYVICTYSVSF